MRPVFTTDNLEVFKIEIGGDDYAERQAAYVAVVTGGEEYLVARNAMFTCQVESNGDGVSLVTMLLGGPPYFGYEASKKAAREFLLGLRDHLGPLAVSGKVCFVLLPEDLRKRLAISKEGEAELVNGLLAEHFTSKKMPKPPKRSGLPLDTPVLAG